MSFEFDPVTYTLRPRIGGSTDFPHRWDESPGVRAEWSRLAARCVCGGQRRDHRGIRGPVGSGWCRGHAGGYPCAERCREFREVTP